MTGLKVEGYKRVDYKNMAHILAHKMLLEQYANSPNLMRYMECFLWEFDELFSVIDDVNFGRYLAYAEGKQLDIIGEILGQSRNVETAGLENFGFVGAVHVDGFADEATPAVGGVFLDGGDSKFTVVPLTDEVYRRVLQARGYCVTLDTICICSFYDVIAMIVPNKGNLHVLETATGDLEVHIGTTRGTAKDISLLRAISSWLVPAGVIATFEINDT